VKLRGKVANAQSRTLAHSHPRPIASGMPNTLLHQHYRVGNGGVVSRPVLLVQYDTPLSPFLPKSQCVVAFTRSPQTCPLAGKTLHLYWPQVPAGYLLASPQCCQVGRLTYSTLVSRAAWRVATRFGKASAPLLAAHSAP
jgi:hypothetical protein